LGLAICHRIVTRHGGTIGVTDNPGGGTRVHFTLPVVGVPAPPVGLPPAQRRLFSGVVIDSTGLDHADGGHPGALPKEDSRDGEPIQAVDARRARC
jgi:hypothetical protein